MDNAVREDGFVGGCADIHPGVTEHEILDMDKLAVHPHVRGRIEEVTTLDEASTNLAAGDPFVEPREVVLGLAECRFYFPISIARTSCSA